MRATERFATAVLLAAFAHPATAGGAALQPSADGEALVDRAAGIAWARCVEGQPWDGRRCSGTPEHLTHAQARSAAARRHAADGLPWRLPRVTELQRLARSARGTTLLAGAPADLHWSASATVDTREVNPYSYRNIEHGVDAGNANSISFLHGWAVDPSSGESRGEVPKRNRLVVRLVRSLD